MMKALSLTQPWAYLITEKGMDVENRTWNTKFRGFFAIHATKSYREDDFEYCRKNFKLKLKRDDVPYGVITGFAELVDTITADDVTPATEKWFIGDYGFVLKNIIKLKTPVPARGSLSFWDVGEEELNLCLAQLTSGERKRMSLN